MSPPPRRSYFDLLKEKYPDPDDLNAPARGAGSEANSADPGRPAAGGASSTRSHLSGGRATPPRRTRPLLAAVLGLLTASLLTLFLGRWPSQPDGEPAMAALRPEAAGVRIGEPRAAEPRIAASRAAESRHAESESPARPRASSAGPPIDDGGPPVRSPQALAAAAAEPPADRPVEVATGRADDDPGSRAEPPGSRQPDSPAAKVRPAIQPAVADSSTQAKPPQGAAVAARTGSREPALETPAVLRPAAIGGEGVASEPQEPPAADPAAPLDSALAAQSRDGGATVTPPRRLATPLPAYTAAAWAAGVEGEVEIRVTIDERGDVAGVDVVRSLPHGLTEAAVAAVMRWKFRPATRDGEPVAFEQSLSLRFAL